MVPTETNGACLIALLAGFVVVPPADSLGLGPNWDCECHGRGCGSIGSSNRTNHRKSALFFAADSTTSFASPLPKKLSSSYNPCGFVMPHGDPTDHAS